MKHVPTTHGTAEIDVYGRSLQRHASRRASREGHVHKPFICSREPSPRQRQETRKPTGSGAAWSLTLKRGPDGRFLFGSTCELSSSELSHYCGDRRGYWTRMRTCVLDHLYRLVLASHHLATHHPGGRIAGGCVTGTAHVVGSAWHTGCRSER